MKAERPSFFSCEPSLHFMRRYNENHALKSYKNTKKSDNGLPRTMIQDKNKLTINVITSY